MAVKKRRTAVHDLEFTLRKVFGKQSFRPLQRDIIVAILDGHDVFVQAATSFGKSLCYQLPAIIDHGITICISPLLALMENQIEKLQSSRIHVATIHSKTPLEKRDEILADLRCGHPRTRLLYVTPEYCMSDTFRKAITVVYSQGELARIAIDEAHCVSEWGHDFRSSYLELHYFRANFPDTPIVCFTATATEKVRNDVIKALALQKANLKVFLCPVSRQNIHYEIRFYSQAEDDRLEDFSAWLQAVYARRREKDQRLQQIEADNFRPESISGIIYTTTRAECEALALRLKERGIGAVAYHAGLSNSQRLEYQSKWVDDVPGYNVIVATTAFGMGIDKDNVRFVVHWCLPKSFEGYYQEAGRGGRDGKAAVSILYYSREDRDKVAWLISRSIGSNSGKDHADMRVRSFRKLADYCENASGCKHDLIMDYFNDSAQGTVCDFACDFCKDSLGLQKRKFARLASEEWMSTQRQRLDERDDYDD